MSGCCGPSTRSLIFTTWSIKSRAAMSFLAQASTQEQIETKRFSDTSNMDGLSPTHGEVAVDLAFIAYSETLKCINSNIL